MNIIEKAVMASVSDIASVAFSNFVNQIGSTKDRLKQVECEISYYSTRTMLFDKSLTNYENMLDRYWVDHEVNSRYEYDDLLMCIEQTNGMPSGELQILDSLDAEKKLLTLNLNV